MSCRRQSGGPHPVIRYNTRASANCISGVGQVLGGVKKQDCKCREEDRFAPPGVRFGANEDHQPTTPASATIKALPAWSKAAFHPMRGVRYGITISPLDPGSEPMLAGTGLSAFTICGCSCLARAESREYLFPDSCRRRCCHRLVDAAVSDGGLTARQRRNRVGGLTSTCALHLGRDALNAVRRHERLPGAAGHVSRIFVDAVSGLSRRGALTGGAQRAMIGAWPTIRLDKWLPFVCSGVVVAPQVVSTSSAICRARPSRR